MMMFDSITTLAHSIEDLFYFLREDRLENIDSSKISDIVLDGIDFIKTEVDKIVEKNISDGDASKLILEIRNLLSDLKRDSATVHSSIMSENVNETTSEPKYFISSVPYNNSKKTFSKLQFILKMGVKWKISELLV